MSDVTVELVDKVSGVLGLLLVKIPTLPDAKRRAVLDRLERIPRFETRRQGDKVLILATKELRALANELA